VAIRTGTKRFFPTDARFGLAQIYWQMGEHKQALETMRAALSPLVGWNMPGIVLLEGRDLLPVLTAAEKADIYPEFVRFCMNAMPDNRQVNIPGTQENFTPREVDILRLIVDGTSNRDIADTLVITENTVKSHVTRILGKLNAKSRAQAAARVRDLNIRL
jgi:DNA-binding CsgD family transcriptional regulator